MAESRAMDADRVNISAPIPAALRRAAVGAAILPAGETPEWIELIPAGEFAGRDGRGPYRLTDAAAVIEASQALRMDAGLPIDYDHATDFAAPAGRPAPAAGWIRGLEDRGGALWGRVEWTRHGAAAVAMREYRYISPVFEYAPSGEIVRLLRAALTNNPNLYLSAISSSAAPATGGPAGGGQELEVPMEGLGSALAEMLGLDSGAGAAEIIAEVRALLAARPAAPGRKAKRGARRTRPRIRSREPKRRSARASESIRKTTPGARTPLRAKPSPSGATENPHFQPRRPRRMRPAKHRMNRWRH